MNNNSLLHIQTEMNNSERRVKYLNSLISQKFKKDRKHFLFKNGLPRDFPRANESQSFDVNFSVAKQSYSS